MLKKIFFLISINLIVNLGTAKADWHCLCYKEIYKGSARLSTACRQTLQKCNKLELKVGTGSAVIVPGSLKTSCTSVSGDYPWSSMGEVNKWIASKKKNSYWTPYGCLLDNARVGSIGGVNSLTILDTVAKWAGLKKDLAVSCDKHGINVHKSLIRNAPLNIYKGRVSKCLIDHEHDLIWFTKRINRQFDTLHVLDLRLTRLSRPKLLSKTWPSNVEIGLKNTKGKLIHSTGANTSYFIVLDLQKLKPIAFPGRMSYTVDNMDSLAKNTRVSAQALKLIKERHIHRFNTVSLNCPKRKMDNSKCEYTDCGTSEHIPNTKICRVLVSETCGDGCYPEYAFYKLNQQKKLGIPFESSSPLQISASGKYVISHGKVFTWKSSIRSIYTFAGWLNSPARLDGR